MKKIIIIALLTGLILIGCFSPYTGEEGSITISFGGSSRAAAWPDGPVNNILPYIEHHITLTNTSTGTAIERTFTGSATFRIPVTPGVYKVEVEDTCGGFLFAMGTSNDPIEVKAGQSAVARIEMVAEQTATFHTVNNSDWGNTVGSLSTATGDHCVIVTQDISTTTTYAIATGNTVNITFIGNGHTINFTGTGNLFTISGGTITMQNLRLVGTSGNTAALVMVNAGGTFTMKSGSISGNTNSADGGGVNVSGGNFTMSGGAIYNNVTVAGGNGGGVYVSGGNFTMSGGAIYKNTATYISGSGYGSGVCVIGGNFTMSGNASISDNTGSSGGVSVGGTGNFTMNGGSIFGHKTTSQGGGVSLSSTGILTMNGGSIYGNTASSNGGGVCIGFSGNVSGTFIMSGGSIYNNNAVSGGGVCLLQNLTFTLDAPATKDSIYGNTATNTPAQVYRITGSPGTINGTANAPTGGW